MPDQNDDIDPQHYPREKQYRDFVDMFHKLKAAQNNGKDPSYDLLAATLHVSRSTVSEFRKRMREESGSSAATNTVPPELIKVFHRAVDQAMVRERLTHAQQLETCFENEASLANALEQAEATLLAAQ